jgi:predicted RNA-binding protein with PIN domain
MTTTLKQTNNIKNGLIGSTVNISPGYGAVPPQLSGQVYTTNTTAGQFLTSTGSNGMSWTTGTTTTPYDAVMTVNQTKPATIEVKGNMVINGRDLEERLDTIEKVLQIPERDVKLEKKHPKLKKLYDEYINALGKYRTFEAIKGEDDGTT